MDNQQKLYEFDKSLFGTSVIKLNPNSKTLEVEKMKFIEAMISFIKPLNFDVLQVSGRPRTDIKDVIISLLMMSYNGMSYRRTQVDLNELKQKEVVERVIPKSTLNDYANNENVKSFLEKLIQASALFFNDNENTLIMDSTWLSTRMYAGGYRKVYDKTNVNFNETRKLHIACLKNSKAIACAITSDGKVHDSPVGRDLIEKVANAGFNITTLLADAGYLSKETYILCKELGILNPYINFRANVHAKGGKSDLWKDRIKIWKEQPEVWREAYRHRVLVEGVFSAIKRKNRNWLRSRTILAQDVELLLRCLTYNLTIIGKYS